MERMLLAVTAKSRRARRVAGIELPRMDGRKPRATEDDGPSPARLRFDALVRERKLRLHPKERRDASQIFRVAELRHLIQQVDWELSAGVKHDPAMVVGLRNYAAEIGATISAKVAAAKPKRFRGLGR
jgi:hypothetical protein